MSVVEKGVSQFYTDIICRKLVPATDNTFQKAETLTHSQEENEVTLLSVKEKKVNQFNTNLICRELVPATDDTFQKTETQTQTNREAGNNNTRQIKAVNRFSSDLIRRELVGVTDNSIRRGRDRDSHTEPDSSLRPRETDATDET